MTSSEDSDLEIGATKTDIEGFELTSLEEIREEHGLDDEWEPRFSADTPRAEEKAEEYEAMGFQARVFPHPDDVSSRQMPKRGDRCVVYTREGDADADEGGMVEDDIL
jgi:hypothetical protein